MRLCWVLVWCLVFFFLREGGSELFLWPLKVPFVGFEFTQTGLIWDCHKGHMVFEGAYGLEEGIHCSAAEPSQLVYLWGKLKGSLEKTACIPGKSV